MKYIIGIGAVIIAITLFGFTKGRLSQAAERNYRIVIGNSANDLTIKVNKELSDGYKPTGGVTIVNGFFYQAVITD